MQSKLPPKTNRCKHSLANACNVVLCTTIGELIHRSICVSLAVYIVYTVFAIYMVHMRFPYSLLRSTSIYFDLLSIYSRSTFDLIL